MLNYHEMANAVRFLSIDAVQKANSGHPGMPMGMAEIGVALFSEFLTFNPNEPKWPNRDRFVLSNGHGSMLLYSLLHLTGYDISMDDLKNFRQLHSKTAGHPEYGYADGIETTTGPLGQGVANAVGMAIAEKLSAERFGEEIFNHYTYVSVGDGCLMEGISHEALEIAGHLELNKLIVLFDDNNICIDGKVSNTSSTKVLERMKSYGFDTFTCDGHDITEVMEIIEKARHSEKPAFISFKTHIGYGSKKVMDTSSAHGSPLGEEEIQNVRNELEWDHEPFKIPNHIYDAFSHASARGKHEYIEWQKKVEKLDEGLKQELNRRLNGTLSDNLKEALNTFKKQTSEKSEKVATRKASGNTLEVIARFVPELISGSADLTGSVNTKTSEMTPILPHDFSGNYMHYGVREHGMAAIMNGMALYGGFIPTSGTFMSFLDYLKPSLRLSALMGLRVIYVLTHDSIGLGEDGPTHQPVEQLATSRATPNVLTFRPCDQVETAECWELALTAHKTPSVMSLTRQGLACLRTEHTDENLCAKGGYILAGQNDDSTDAILIATGSEVEIAMQAREKLKESGVNARVVSMPCMELFDRQSTEYKLSVLPCEVSTRVAIEAGAELGWHKYIGAHGTFIGMSNNGESIFGASAPAEELYEHFGITAENAATTILDKIRKKKKA
ncbi:MAG: Transketolase 1 [Proteobacteria bacterium]|nr:MAG: Transketolase 1 [Pseudomonadota bacterium]